MTLTYAYFKPESFQEAFELVETIGRQTFRFLAGGTDLLPALRAKSLSIDCLLDLTGIKTLSQIKVEDNVIRIGALVTFRNLAKNEYVCQTVPALVSAANQLGAVQTRSLATLGGNLCSAVPSVDAAPPLLALDAKVVLKSKRGERIVPLDQFFVDPRRTVLGQDEILTEITVPVPATNFAACFMKIGRRKALSLSIVNGATGLSLNDNGEIEVARIALGAVAPTPMRIYEAEEMLIGNRPSPELMAKVAAVAEGKISPISDLRASAEYRKMLSNVLVQRTLDNALELVSQ